MKSFFFIVLIVFVFFSCAKTNSGPNTDQGQVLFMNACLNAPALDFPTNGSKGIAYLHNSGYQKGAAKDSSTLSLILVTGTSNILTFTNFTLQKNSYYSVFASGTINSPSSITVRNDLTAPPSGGCYLTIIKPHPDSIADNIFINNIQIATNIGYGYVSNNIFIAAGTYNLYVKSVNNQSIYYTLNSQKFSAGKIYTIVITGFAKGAGSSAIGATIVNNN